MTDSDQWKLSAYWHNEYNRAWYILDTIQKLALSGKAFQIIGEGGIVTVDVFDEDEAGCAHSDKLVDAIQDAINNLERCCKSSSGDTADQCNSDEQLVIEKKQGISGRLEGNLKAAILPHGKNDKAA